MGKKVNVRLLFNSILLILLLLSCKRYPLQIGECTSFPGRIQSEQINFDKYPEYYHIISNPQNENEVVILRNQALNGNPNGFELVLFNIFDGNNRLITKDVDTRFISISNNGILYYKKWTESLITDTLRTYDINSQSFMSINMGSVIPIDWYTENDGEFYFSGDPSLFIGRGPINYYKYDKIKDSLILLLSHVGGGNTFSLLDNIVLSRNSKDVYVTEIASQQKHTIVDFDEEGIGGGWCGSGFVLYDEDHDKAFFSLGDGVFMTDIHSGKTTKLIDNCKYEFTCLLSYSNNDIIGGYTLDIRFEDGEYVGARQPFIAQYDPDEEQLNLRYFSPE